MINHVSINDAAHAFCDLLRRVIAEGECVVLTEDDIPVAELTPVRPGLTLRELPALLNSLPHLSTADLDAFAADLAGARAADALTGRNVWD